MLATAIVMFREVLEAALIIAIVLSASKSIAGRGRWVGAGVVLGLAGASLVAVLAAKIAASYSGNGQAVMNAVILLSAVLMLTWHTVWMSAHGRELAAELSAVSVDVQTGKRPLAALLIVTMAAVMREGSEAVLFLWAIAAGGEQRVAMTLGGAAGIVAGVLVGLLLYRGLLRIPARYFFSVTGWLIILLASGLAAQAAGFLNQAGLLPALGNTVWNTSGILSQSSIAGQLLHILVGYVARPSGIELVFYGATLLIILSLLRVQQRSRMRGAKGRAATGVSA
ncbi:MAG TPA: FTR1 family protein [Burkholderiales bacterium]|nr:FTR1 family protein [Burkholderiales bacterium]